MRFFQDLWDLWEFFRIYVFFWDSCDFFGGLWIFSGFIRIWVFCIYGNFCDLLEFFRFVRFFGIYEFLGGFMGYFWDLWELFGINGIFFGFCREVYVIFWLIYPSQITSNEKNIKNYSLVPNRRPPPRLLIFKFFSTLDILIPPRLLIIRENSIQDKNCVYH